MNFIGLIKAYLFDTPVELKCLFCNRLTINRVCFFFIRDRFAIVVCDSCGKEHLVKMED